MKYSEAIRLGSMLYPQCTGLAGLVSDDGYGVCANGAAALAVGFTLQDVQSQDPVLVSVQPIIDLYGRIQPFACPGCSEHCRNVLNACAHLNDTHQWTRERIADWLAESGNDFEIDLRARSALAAEPVAAGVAE